MAIELPPAVTAESSSEAISARMAEEIRRKDITVKGVAQEALDCLAEIDLRKGSSKELFERYGYSLRHVLMPAQKEEKRIIQELGKKPSKDVSSSMLNVKDIQGKFGISEFVVKEIME